LTEAVESTTVPTTTTTQVESLPFQDSESVPEQQLWTDATSVSVDWTVGQDDPDGPVQIIGGFTAGQGLTARWTDPLGDDLLIMIRGDQVFQAVRVGNEVFIGEVEPDQGDYFFAEVLFTLLEPLETGQLPNSAFTFVEVDGVTSGRPGVVYSLAPNETRGVISGGDQVPPIDVTRQDSGVIYAIPDAETTLTREQVGNSTNTILRTWYLDQAG